MITFKDFLRSYRDDRGYTLHTLSEYLDVHYTTVSDWIVGKRYPRANAIIIAARLGIDVSLMEQMLREQTGEDIQIYVDSPFNRYLKEWLINSDSRYSVLIEAAGLYSNSIAHYLRKGVLPSVYNVPKFAKAFGITPVACAVLVVDSDSARRCPNALSYILRVCRVALGVPISAKGFKFSVSCYTWESWEISAKLPRDCGLYTLSNLTGFSIPKLTELCDTTDTSTVSEGLLNDVYKNMQRSFYFNKEE